MTDSPSSRGGAAATVVDCDQSIVFWIQVIVFVDMFGVALVVPLLTTYFRAAGVDTEMVGYISSLYYFCQLIGGVAIGGLSDIVPRRDVVMLSFAGSAVSYFIVGYTDEIWLLFATRAMVGLVKQTMTISTSMVTEHGHVDSRASNIASLAAASTLAFIIGPAIGSLLYKMNPQYPTMMASSLFICNIGICFLTIPRHCKQLEALESENISGEKIDKKHRMHWIRAMYDKVENSVHSKGVFLNLVALFSITFVERAMNYNNMISYFEIRYEVEAYTLGLIASATSIIALVAQTFFINGMKAFWGSDERAIIAALFCSAVAYFIEFFCISIYHYLILVVPLFTVCANVIQACSKSALSASIPIEHVGKLFGALNVLEAVAGVVAPIYGSELFMRTGYVTRSIAASAHYFVLAIWVQWVLLQDQKFRGSTKK
jgi:MFS family permease